ncbi:putative disease resistance protein RGA3 [Triticum dicoccoides]|uniref:putative disease resistance protein RGA3 n=1 Tax=Triticum dicoccoides TaxID=85692 RepID=UPI00188F921C|nr:putative disease resistance protein RGA3 [Triticum dicoccoides]
MLVALSAARWVVGKALAPVADGLLEAWDASKRLGLNIEALRTELLLVQATLEAASRKQIDGPALEELLGKLRHSAHSAEDLLDELDYFRIHDELHNTYDAADQHAKGCLHDLALNARHTAKAVLGLSACSSAACCPNEPGEVEDARQQQASCCTWPRGRQRSRGDSSSTPNTNQVDEDGGCMLKLGKLLPCSYLRRVRDDHSGQPTHSGAPRRAAPMLGFNRVDVSERMKRVIEQLQPVRTEVAKVLQSCGRTIVPDIAKSRPITTGQSIEPKLYGRVHIMNGIIHDMTKGRYHSKDLTVLPIVGPGGIGKTTLIQHIYRNQQVRNHFQVVIWVCVSLKFNLNKLLEEIETYIPRVEGEKYGRVEELIEQRLRSKRFLLVLDDIWEFSDEDDWKRLLLPLKTSQEKGSMILLTTRFPIIAKMVKTTDYIELEGLESEQFRKLFLRFIFGDEPFRSDHNFLLDTGDKIMEKLKGSPLAAKTVGTLLRKCLNLRHWRRVLESKEWERQTGANDIMPALKLSYDYLSFHQQQCFFYSALFPEDHEYSTTELINLWIGLDILQPGVQNQTLEGVGLMNLNDLVTHGFFKEEETNGRVRYVMHDLLHDLALKVGSHECLTVHQSNVGSVEIKPSIRHLSIIIDDDHTMCDENFKSQLRKLKTRLKVRELHTLMLFGEMDESFSHILNDLFKEANALRFIRLVDMSSSVKFILPNNSALVHLRYLCLGTKYMREIPLAISKFYHLRILDLGWWHGCCDVPKDLSNLAKLRHFYTPSDELHSHIYNVGKLTLLEELKVFKVNKESEGFEPKQLEHLTELRELGMYNLENIHTKEEATKAKLIEKNYLERLTLDWDTERSNSKPDVEEVVLESLQPHRYLQELSIRGHGGPSCPTWLGDKLTVEGLQSLHLIGVSWQCLPSFGKMWDLRTLILKHIAATKEFVIEQTFCGLRRLELVGLANFEKWVPSQDAHHVFPLLQVLIIRDCPKLLELPFSNHIVDQDWSIDWFPKLQELQIENCPEFLLVAHIPWTETLHSVKIRSVKLLEKFEYSKSSYRAGLEIVGKGDLQMLDQVLAFNNLTGLEQLMLSTGSFSSPCCFIFPPSLQYLIISGVEGMGTLEPLSNLTSLTRLVLENCGEDQSCKGLGPLLAVGGQLRELLIYGSPRFFVGWDPNPRQVLQDGGGEEHELLVSTPNSSKLQELCTDEAMGLLVVPICSFLSSSLTRLHLYGNQKMKCFTKEQEGALHLLASLQELEFSMFDKLQSLPAGLHKLTSLRRLEVRSCPCVRSLPEDGLPELLQQLDVWLCNNEELKQQCRGLAGTIPKIN